MAVLNTDRMKLFLWMNIQNRIKHPELYRSVEAALDADDVGEVAILSAQISRLQEVERQPVTRVYEDVAYSKTHSPTHWRKVFAVDGQPISQSTFRRMIDRGEIHIHPESTTKRIAIDMRDLPPDYTE